MPSKRPTTIPEYIEAAPLQGQPHLRRLYALLQRVAPQAEEAIKWGTPFFVEPRFLFAFSAHKAHLNFTPTEQGQAPFHKELEKHKTTPKGLLQIPYDQPLPEDLIRKIVEHRLQTVRELEDDSFWCRVDFAQVPIQRKRQFMALLTTAERSDVEDLAQHVERHAP